jgi:long-subunit fatty acid transport protein
LPGSGAISTSRAGAAVASTTGGEALGLNPAGMARTTGTTITVSAAIIGYSMDFQRAGTYDPISDEDRPYEGQRYGKITNDPDLPLGIGKYQPVPVITVTTDLGGRVPGLVLAAGLYAPNAYPFRDMTGGYQFNADFDAAPPPSRYDILKQEAALLFPSLAAAYRINPHPDGVGEIDIGARFTWGFADIDSTVAVWGAPGNYEEAATKDAEFRAHAKDNFIPTFGLGVRYKPIRDIELGFNFNYAAVVRASGTATSNSGPRVEFSGNATVIGPVPDDASRCAKGGTFDEQKACVDFQLPMNAQLGGRYIFHDSKDRERGDIELNVGWENFGKTCNDAEAFAGGCTSPSRFRVVVDAAAYVDRDQDPNTPLTEDDIAITLADNYVDHRFNDVYNVRLGGSYVIPVGSEASGNSIVVRGGLGYDTQAAEDGWLRADIDGAARTTVTTGASYRTNRWEATLGFGAIIEGENTNSGNCAPLPTAQEPSPGCAADGSEQPVDDRRGPDPINPIVVPSSQAENPVNQGTFNSNYILFMLGFSTWF